jgi:hypothetical protein
MINFEIKNMYFLETEELKKISGGGFYKDLGLWVGSFYDTHNYKGGEWSAWG